MRLRVAALCLALALGACGKQHGADQGSAGNAPPSKSLTPPPSTASAPAATPALSPQSAAAKSARPNQDGSETMEEGAGDSGAHNALYAAVASTVVAATPSASAETLSGPALWQEGVNYTRIVPAQPTDVPAGQVEVLEFFWYACPHCYSLDPQVEAFRKSKPPYVTFTRVHVTWTEGHRSLARLFYTLQSLGKLDALHGEVFKEIHVNGDPLVAQDAGDTDQTERIQTAWAKKEGIPEDAFKKAYHSFQVDQAVIKADELVQRYRIDGVPTFVINGKFITDVRTAGSPEHLMALVGDLAAQEHKH
jgi:protein dithiol oxidoreductase (disulfide-forming)